MRGTSLKARAPWEMHPAAAAAAWSAEVRRSKGGPNNLGPLSSFISQHCFPLHHTVKSLTQHGSHQKCSPSVVIHAHQLMQALSVRPC